MSKRRSLTLLGAVAGFSQMVAACDRAVIEVDDPFYLMYPESPSDRALFRCIGGAGRGCSSEGLPDPLIVAAGADSRYVVLEQRSDTGATAYFYFDRVPEERRGWGNNPEQIVGPLDEQAFTAASAALDLPLLDVRP